MPGRSAAECVDHVLGGALRHAGYLEGIPPERLEWTRTADHSGSDAVGAHRRRSAGLRRRFAGRPDAEAVVVHSLGPLTVRELLGMRIQELLVHSWDLSPAALDDSADDMCDLALELGTAGRDLCRRGGALGQSTATADDDPRTHLLRECGRVPG